MYCLITICTFLFLSQLITESFKLVRELIWDIQSNPFPDPPQQSGEVKPCFDCGKECDMSDLNSDGLCEDCEDDREECK